MFPRPRIAHSLQTGKTADGSNAPLPYDPDENVVIFAYCRPFFRLQTVCAADLLAGARGPCPRQFNCILTKSCSIRSCRSEHRSAVLHAAVHHAVIRELAFHPVAHHRIKIFL
jgi:hypothetical protein